jgi:hypothetical protein
LGNRAYTEEEVTEMVALAQEVGITKAIQQLGYGSWGTVTRWCKQRGVSADDVDPLKSRAATIREFYKEQEKLAICQQGLQRVFEVLTTKEISPDLLTSDDIKKLADATKRLLEAMALVEGKPTNITEQKQPNDAFQQMLEEFNNVSSTHSTNAHVSQRDLEHEEER